ncbi:MAG: A/G-specific adenine glycosylase [Candidatus Marinimicrobia bacterium]|nr:A/G-specific adenine glycosylase [Candidatus Neomarinimicrobiota bacterium]
MEYFAKDLLSWYGRHKRSLPWRGESDPYKIWLAEVMLQQTQVNTVIPYYHRWLKKFPNVNSVAKDTQDAVLKMWEGLGYYSRCRNFHKACQIVLNKFGGEIPSTWEEFRNLPGVGDYTASAVLSFAFKQPYPVLDGNVNRVMARILAYPKPVAKVQKEFLAFLSDKIDHQRPGEFNQAMMELGSLVCRKNQARCLECPVSEFCKGYTKGEPERYPIQERKKPRPHQTIVAGVIWNEGRFLIQKRPENALLGGLWEFPGGKVQNGENLESALIREIREETGISVIPSTKIGEINHAYTHFTITLHGYHCTMLNEQKSVYNGTHRKWITREEIRDYAFPKANHKLFEKLDSENWQH